MVGSLRSHPVQDARRVTVVVTGTTGCVAAVGCTAESDRPPGAYPTRRRETVARRAGGEAEVARVELLTEARSVHECETACYRIHSIGGVGRSRHSTASLRTKSQMRPGPPGAAPHLAWGTGSGRPAVASRQEVRQMLRVSASRPSSRASIMIGSGSGSYEPVRVLVDARDEHSAVF
jgi:hypothetical protein